ncbi:MAG: alpha-isopropylmalate synthase regulatory domain-containing protein, partial [Pseudomonadota bacterium]|nr:alpha-isopropylmalate synthase regulatory domain-containing protein [Pseudomonadota bacterium]
ISAFGDALHKMTGIDLQVVQFEEVSLGEGSDAQAMAFVQISLQGQRFTAAAQDSDTLAASLESIVTALNIAISQGVKAA